MRKYFLLFAAILLLVSILWRLYYINRPTVGPIGDGTIPPQFWIGIISSSSVAIFALVAAFQLFKKITTKNRNSTKEILTGNREIGIGSNEDIC